MIARPSLIKFITDHPSHLLKRTTLIELCSITEHKSMYDNIILKPTDTKDIYTADIVLKVSDKPDDAPILVDIQNNTIYGYTSLDDRTTTFYKIHDQLDTPIMDIYDTFELTSDMIENYQGDPIETTIGKFILNYFILVYPFGSIVPYINNIFSYSKICKDIARHILNKVITVDQYDKFMRAAYLLGGFAELFVPCMTTKSLTTGDEVIARRDELFKKYKDQLNDPIVLVKIEDELIAMDKKYLSTDPASGWIISSKEYDTCRKKMFITSGITEAFSNNPGEFTFIPQALNEKMDVTKFPAICGDIRRGSYMRGIQTAEGGAVTKLILRLFQNVSIDIDDCGSKEGISITLYKKDFEDYEGRYVITDTGEIVELTKDNFHQYINKPIRLRSPKHCNSREVSGFCYTCFGKVFKQLGVKQAGMLIAKISSTLMYTAMKAMHKSKIAVVKIGDLNDFVI